MVRWPKYKNEDGNAGGGAGDTNTTTNIKLQDAVKTVGTGDTATTEPLPPATIDAIKFDASTGCITGTTKDTKEDIVIGYLAIGNVTNPNGVSHIGSSYYTAGAGAGDLNVTMLGGAAKEVMTIDAQGNEVKGIRYVNGSIQSLALSKTARRILKLFGKDVENVVTTVGPEQEYFLIDKSVYEKRKDLIYTGRTLYGAPAPKGQELEDHYFGTIKQRVVKYMADLDMELWKLGVLAKTKHNEVAPAQHELAPIFSQSNVAADANQLTMEMMKKVASRHNMVCLLHEKPFEGVNGSGKHNNWSISTDKGENLLEPGDTPEDNAQFLLFLAAVIKATDDYQDLLRLSVASAGNDHRLGANEAPPAIVSMFLGEELDGILNAIAEDRTYSKRAKCEYEIGVSSLPKFTKDSTDRNRTSPFAFTGNKFEFRMLGSTFSISGPNIILNTIVAESLDQFADELEKADDFMAAVKALVKKTYLAHKRIIFNGNGYSDEWVKEAAKRGLLNLASAPEALP